MTNVTTMKDVPWDNGVTAAALSNSWVLRITPMGCQKQNSRKMLLSLLRQGRLARLATCVLVLFTGCIGLESVFSFNV